MGSILQFFDLTRTNSSGKFAAHKRQGDGHEAPRNSLEYTIQSSHCYDAIQEDIPYSCQVKHQPAKMNYRTNDAPMKRLIDEEMSKKMNNKCSSPSVVARLMGMDALPSETRPTIHAHEWKPRSSLPRNRGVSSHSSASDRRGRQDLMPYDIWKESNQSTTGFKLAKPRPREHPQEELLQKFKKDFEAWQSSKVWENSRTIETDNYVQQAKRNQILAQENVKKERVARYWEYGRHPTHKKPARPESYASRDQPKSVAEQGIVLPRESYMNKQSAMAKFSEKQDRSPSAARIVILRPSAELSDDAEGSWPGSPGLLEKEASMQDFLEEVKARLKSEILGKARNSTTALGLAADSSFGKRSGDTKQYARCVAKQIRESVTSDIGTSLARSESTRSYKSEFQFNGPELPELVSRNTRKLLPERLKNVIRNETDVDIPLAAGGRSRTMHRRVKSRPMHDFPKSGPRHWEDVKPPAGSKVMGGEQMDAVFDSESMSPRNLVRSFSAPVSGTAFAKLLLQDQHLLTGAHVHPKHEASEHPPPESRRRKKDGFNLKGTVSSLRQNLTLKGKLFGKKTHPVDESSPPSEFDSSRALVIAPSIVAKAGSVQENSTEVPPSPASVLSSSPDEFSRPGIPSPVSPLLTSLTEDQATAKISTDDISVIPESTHLSRHVEHNGVEEVATEECDSDDTIEVEGHVQAYTRDVLITAGLYEGEIFDEAFQKWDPTKKPIPKWVFDEVEDAHRQTGKLDELGSLICDGETKLSRNMLFDMINEAMPKVLRPTTSSPPTFKKWVLSPNEVPRRKKLLDDLWSQIQVYMNSNPNESSSADYMVAQDVRRDRWCTLLHEDVYVTGKKMELVILDDLIDEFTLEMLTISL